MEAVILIGVQGSGKSTFYEQRFSRTHERISLDIQGTRRRERAALDACLRGCRAFVVDNTNPRAADRAPFIAAARTAGFRVIGYFFEIGLRTAIARNKGRAGKAAIPVPGLVRTFKALEPPKLEEGFDELHWICVDEHASRAAGADGKTGRMK